MLKTTAGVFVLAGDPIPVKCRCGCVYEPKLGSANSVCPECLNENDHSDPALAMQETELREQ